jgi:hypothetical protein
MRSLHIDSFRASRFGLLLAIGLMVALLVWFFIAKVTLYEVGSSIQVMENGMLQVAFSPEARGRLRAGQPAVVRLNPGADQSTITLPAMIYDIPSEGGDVQLYLLTNELPPGGLQGKLNGQVEVEVEHLTPAELVLRSSGKYLNRSPAPLSTQNPQE